MEKICIIYVTASDKKEAEKIAKELIASKLAACVNVFDQISSFYRWEGKQEKSYETALVIKTKESLFPEIETKIKNLHSYSCPCILAISITRANKDYLDWIVKETK